MENQRETKMNARKQERKLNIVGCDKRYKIRKKDILEKMNRRIDLPINLAINKFVSL